MKAIGDFKKHANRTGFFNLDAEAFEVLMVFVAQLAATMALEARTILVSLMLRTDHRTACFTQPVATFLAVGHMAKYAWQRCVGQADSHGGKNVARYVTSRNVRLDRFLIAVGLCSTLFAWTAGDCSAADMGPAVVRDYAQFGRELEDAEKLEMLDMIALATRSNLEKIKTARGTYRFVDWFHYAGSVPRMSGSEDTRDDNARLAIPARALFESGSDLMEESPKDGYWEIVSGEVQFAWDNRSNKYHAIYQVGEQTGFIDTATGLETEASHAQYSIHWTLTPEYMLEYDTHQRLGEIEGFPSVGSTEHYSSPVVYRRDPDTGKRQTRIVDVRDFFSPGGVHTWDLCRRAAKLVQGGQAGNDRGEGGGGIALFMKGMPRPLVTMVLNYGDTRQSIFSYGGSVEFNPVSFSISSPRGSSAEWTIEYRESSGVFFPHELRLKKYKKVKGEVGLSYARQFSLVDIAVNESISDQEFDTAAFRIPYACRMVDKVKDQMFAYDDKVGFVPALEFVYNPFRDPNVTAGKVEPKATEKTGVARIWLIIIINACVLLLLIIGVYVVRRSTYK